MPAARCPRASRPSPPGAAARRFPRSPRRMTTWLPRCRTCTNPQSFQSLCHRRAGEDGQSRHLRARSVSSPAAARRTASETPRDRVRPPRADWPTRSPAYRLCVVVPVSGLYATKPPSLAAVRTAVTCIAHILRAQPTPPPASTPPAPARPAPRRRPALPTACATAALATCGLKPRFCNAETASALGEPGGAAIAGAPCADGSAPALSRSSLTIRAASFGPTPCALATIAASPPAQARCRSSTDSAERIASATLLPTPCTAVSRRNQSRSAAVAKPIRRKSVSLTWRSVNTAAMSPAQPQRRQRRGRAVHQIADPPRPRSPPSRRRYRRACR